MVFHPWGNSAATYNLAMWEDGGMSSLMALSLSRGGSADPTTRAFLMPAFDGAINVNLKDGDDFKVMERGICLGLRVSFQDGSAYCGPPLSSFY